MGCEELFLKDSYLREASAKVVRVKRSRGKRAYIVLDRTIFHPLGGGQPSDKGLIVAGERRFRVKKAIRRGGEVLHYGVFADRCAFREGEEVLLRLDWEHRYTVMRLHTAGHILDFAVASAHGGPVDTLSAFHGPPRAYLEYALREEPRLWEIEAAANRVVAEDRPVRVFYVGPEELARSVYNAPNMARVPAAERYRVVEIVGVNAMPCTGTHVRRTGEVGAIRLLGAEETGRGWKIFYAVE